ncbi:SEC-C metal-binding domain-containing protein [Singulisphaera acidiphila]|uniref:SEC-C metal-binding domain-containing protein n=1 Tax=Singulisphaera acidiphila TaxID=466153 RepID=UPI001C267083
MLTTRSIDNQLEVSHATGFRRHALLSRSCPSGVGGILSETHVKRGHRIVHGNKELQERLGRNDPCPCGSGLLFKKCCRNTGWFRRSGAGPLRAIG